MNSVESVRLVSKQTPKLRRKGSSVENLDSRNVKKKQKKKML